MSASLGDVIMWIMPVLIGVVVSLCGLLALLLGRLDPGSSWEVRGAAAVALGLLALPTLPLVFLVNPSLSQRIDWASETAEWKQRGAERRERKNAIAERQQEIAGNLAKLDGDKAVAPGVVARQALEHLKLQQESLELSKEKLALTEEDGLDSNRLGSVGRGRPNDPMPYLLPLGWGAALYALGWLLGRKKSAAETTVATPALAVLSVEPGPPPDRSRA
jgi:hypothetical protein